MIQLGLGCVGLGSGAGRSLGDDVRLVQAAVDLGVGVFDTADVYGGGASEHVLGRAVRGRRDEVVLATKGGFVFRSRRPAEQWMRRRAKALRERRAGSAGAADGTSAPASRSYSRQDFSPQHLRRAVHDSLRRLRTDRIDVYQLHGPEDVLPEVFDALADLVTVGDVVRFGVGLGSLAHADEWVRVAGLHQMQVPFGVLDPQAATTTLPLARERGVEVWARGVLGGGLLALAERDPNAIADHPKRELVGALRRLADESGVDAYRLAMGFVRAHADDLSVVLVGTTSPEHLRGNLEALAAPPLAPDVLAALDELTASARELG